VLLYGVFTETDTTEGNTMFLEYDWTFGVYKPRFGNTFTSVNGFHSFASMDEAKQHLAACKLQLGKKTDTRTWQIEVQS